MTTSRTRPRLHHSGDSLVLVELEARISPEVNARVVAMANALTDARVTGVRDVVPGYGSVGVHIDPLCVDMASLERVIAHAWDLDVSAEAPVEVVELPVCYGGRHGPDLEAVAQFAGGTTDDVVRLHQQTEYRVYMLGFLPGFAYLGTVDSRIAMPRRAAPRAVVRAGSVGIAGGQTGVYPSDSPGGWQIIGRTPVPMFDPHRAQPATVRPGMCVRFVAMPHDAWPPELATE